MLIELIVVETYHTCTAILQFDGDALQGGDGEAILFWATGSMGKVDYMTSMGSRGSPGIVGLPPYTLHVIVR